MTITALILNKLNKVHKEFQILKLIKIIINGKEQIIQNSKIEDWKRFENNNPTTALNILYIK